MPPLWPGAGITVYGTAPQSYMPPESYTRSDRLIAAAYDREILAWSYEQRLSSNTRIGRRMPSPPDPPPEGGVIACIDLALSRRENPRIRL